MASRNGHHVPGTPYKYRHGWIRLDLTDFEGEHGNTQHITRTATGRLPVSVLKNLPGARGEVPGEHRNKQGDTWTDFLADVQEHGVKSPIFITVDPDTGPRISEGNHRRDAAVEGGLDDVPVEIRYYGKAEEQHGDWYKPPRRKGNQYTKYGTDRQGSPAMTRKQAHAAGFTEGPYYHATDHADAVRREGFITKGAEPWEIGIAGNMEEFKRFDSVNQVWLGKSPEDVGPHEDGPGYGKDVVEVWAKPGSVRDGEGMTLAGGGYVIDPADVVPIKAGLTTEEKRSWARAVLAEKFPEKVRTKVPTTDEELTALQDRWAGLDRELLAFVNDPKNPGARAIIDEQLDVQKAIHHGNLDTGGPEGIGKPGGARDVVVVGTGPAGLAAGIYGATEGLDTIMLDASSEVGGQAGMSSRIENVMGFPAGVSGSHLAATGLEQARRVGADVQFGVRAERIDYDPDTGLKTVHLNDGTSIETRSVIIAGGVQFRKMDFDGADAEGVVYGDSDLLKQVARDADGNPRPVVIVGGANSAGQAAIDASSDGRQVALVIRGPDMGKSMSSYLVTQCENDPNIRVMTNTEVASVEKDARGHVAAVVTKAGERLDAGGIGLFLGSVPNAEWAGVDLNERGYITTTNGEFPMESSIPGVFAAGDIRAENKTHRVAVAAGEGSVAISYVHGYIPKVKARPVDPTPIERVPNDEADEFAKSVHDYDVAHPVTAGGDEVGPDWRKVERAKLALVPPSAENVVAMWEQATNDEKREGTEWYAEAHNIAQSMADKYGLRLDQAAGIIAVYSPQTGWGTNLIRASEVMRTGHGIGGPGSGVMATGKQRELADRILSGEHYDDVFGNRTKSIKVRNFAKLIENGGDLDDEQRVVMDRHAIGVTRGISMSEDQYTVDRPASIKRYEMFSEAYREATRIMWARYGIDITPHQLQAVTWLARQRLNRQQNRGEARNTRGLNEWKEWLEVAQREGIGVGGAGTGYELSVIEWRDVADIELAYPDLALPEPPPYAAQPERGAEKVHVIEPPPEDDMLVQAIALIIGADVSVNAMVAGLVPLFAPFKVGEEAIRMALGLARNGTANRPNAHLDGLALTPRIKVARDSELYFRAAYFLHAAHRLQHSLDEGETVRTALSTESPYYRAHEKARSGRLRAAAQVERAAQVFGPRLGWYLNPLINNEAECIAANGHNFDPLVGTVIGLPGAVHSNCGCYAGPPHEGAAMVNEVLGNVVRFSRSKRPYKLRAIRSA